MNGCRPSYIVNVIVYQCRGKWRYRNGEVCARTLHLHNFLAARSLEMPRSTTCELRRFGLTVGGAFLVLDPVQLPEYDLGYWTRYSRCAVAVTQIASTFYHRLHIQ